MYAIITKVSDVSTGGQYETEFTIYGDNGEQWQETTSFNQTEYSKTADVQTYIKKRMAFYQQSVSVVADLKKLIGVEIKP